MGITRAFAACVVLILAFQCANGGQKLSETRSGIYENQTVREYFRVQYAQTIGLSTGGVTRHPSVAEGYVNQQIKHLVAETENSINTIKQHFQNASEGWTAASKSTVGGPPRWKETRRELNQLEKATAKLHQRLRYIFPALDSDDRSLTASGGPAGKPSTKPELKALDHEIQNAEKQIREILFGNSVVEVTKVNDNMLLALDRVRQLSRLLQQRAEEEK